MTALFSDVNYLRHFIPVGKVNGNADCLFIQAILEESKMIERRSNEGALMQHRLLWGTSY